MKPSESSKQKVTYEFISREAFVPIFKEHRPKLFKEDFDFDINAVLSEQEQLQKQALAEPLNGVHQHHLIAKIGEELVGWSVGIQQSAEVYYMSNSAVFPAFRTQGIYTDMLHQVMAFIGDLGFQRVCSKHKMANNAILIPKLKFGFIITGFDVMDIFGPLIEMNYYFNEERRKLLGVRMGTQKMTAAMLDLISK